MKKLILMGLISITMGMGSISAGKGSQAAMNAYNSRMTVANTKCTKDATKNNQFHRDFYNRCMDEARRFGEYVELQHKP